MFLENYSCKISHCYFCLPTVSSSGADTECKYNKAGSACNPSINGQLFPCLLHRTLAFKYSKNLSAPATQFYVYSVKNLLSERLIVCYKINYITTKCQKDGIFYTPQLCSSNALCNMKMTIFLVNKIQYSLLLLDEFGLYMY